MKAKSPLRGSVTLPLISAFSSSLFLVCSDECLAKSIVRTIGLWSTMLNLTIKTSPTFAPFPNLETETFSDTFGEDE